MSRIPCPCGQGHISNGRILAGWAMFTVWIVLGAAVYTMFGAMWVLVTSMAYLAMVALLMSTNTDDPEVHP